MDIRHYLIEKSFGEILWKCRHDHHRLQNQDLINYFHFGNVLNCCIVVFN